MDFQNELLAFGSEDTRGVVIAQCHSTFRKTETKKLGVLSTNLDLLGKFLENPSSVPSWKTDGLKRWMAAPKAAATLRLTCGCKVDDG
jgi:hypothetical protein